VTLLSGFQGTYQFNPFNPFLQAIWALARSLLRETNHRNSLLWSNEGKTTFMLVVNRLRVSSAEFITQTCTPL